MERITKYNFKYNFKQKLQNIIFQNEIPKTYFTY